MSYSISPSTAFSDINWNSLENRPQINASMPFCEESNWHQDIKCCIDGYSIEHVIDVAYEHGLENSPEVRFLDQYPCLNGPELEHFAELIEAMPSGAKEDEQPQFPSRECLSQTIFERLSDILPTAILKTIKPFLCPQSADSPS